jgi:toxin ParE1/3/4
MTFRVELSELARQDLKDIWDYLHPKNAAACLRLFQRISDKLNALGEFSGIGVERRLGSQAYRMVVCGQYNILYLADPELVRVLRIVHGARNMKNLDGL